jgi:hypothetical protein
VLTITLVLRSANAWGVIHALGSFFADGNTPAPSLVMDPAGHLLGATGFYLA